MPKLIENRFARHPTFALVTFLVLTLALLLFVFNLVLERTFGLGDPLLYDTNPWYGYRPQPNQEIRRLKNTCVRINNLGLRADEDWDEVTDDKVLFIGDSVTYGGSYIDNDELFSRLAVRDLPGMKSGNAAVNGWGIDNMHGLIVKSGFTPAEYYVIVVGEIDFYRRFTQLKGLPFWCKKPSSGIAELLHHICLSFTRSRYRDWTEYSSLELQQSVVEHCAQKLNEIESYLTSMGRQYLTYITPFRRQVLGETPRNRDVARSLRRQNIRFTNMIDRLNGLGLSRESKEDLFVDHVHLSKEGHVLWADIIGADLNRLVASSSR